MIRPEPLRLPLFAARPAAAVLLLACLSLLTGCPPKEKPTQILPRGELLQQYNERAEQFVRLWSKCSINVRLPRNTDPKTGEPLPGTGYRSYTIDGNFILRKPRDLYLEGRAFGSPQFGLHSNEAMYWLYVKPENVEYHGRYGGPGLDRFPMRPDQLLRGLGIYRVGEEGQLLVFRRDDKHDVLQVLRPYDEAALRRVSLAGFSAVYISEELYLDRYVDSHLPAQVRLYDLLGNILVRSSLEDYRPITLHPQIELTEAQLLEDPFALPQVDRSRVLGTVPVAHRLVFNMPSSGVTVTLKLSDVDLSLELEDEAFQYKAAPVERHIDLDVEAERPEPRTAAAP